MHLYLQIFFLYFHATEIDHIRCPIVISLCDWRFKCDTNQSCSATEIKLFASIASNWYIVWYSAVNRTVKTVYYINTVSGHNCLSPPIFPNIFQVNRFIEKKYIYINCFLANFAEMQNHYCKMFDFVFIIIFISFPLFIVLNFFFQFGHDPEFVKCKNTIFIWLFVMFKLRLVFKS